VAAVLSSSLLPLHVADTLTSRSAAIVRACP
jgi:hypothetical protein